MFNLCPVLKKSGGEGEEKKEASYHLEVTGENIKK